MKFDVIEREVVSSGAITTKDITLSANAKAFKIIFGQIYPDIIKAIVRELFTNAWDSQKMAGTLDTPIDIHLPSIIEPWFSIRDYGLGMTTEIIDEVYSKVFESTKDSSNDEAGMFGMGSKTPLGYTDGFAVTSFVDGTLYAYDIFIGSNGNPQISLNACESTDEPNGVEVTVAVKQEDFDKFKGHAELFALHAGTPININRERFLNKRDILLSGDDWILYEYNDKFTTGVFIRMGCVLYQIDRELVISNLNYYPSWEERNKLHNIMGLPLVLDFNIGDFDVTGSREDIVYSTQAAHLIHDRLIKSHTEILSLVNGKINECSSFREAHNYSTQLVNLNIISSRERMDLKYGAMKLNRIERYAYLITDKYSMMHNEYGRNTTKIRSYTKSLDLSNLMLPNNTVYIIIDDGKSKRAPARVGNLIEEAEKYTNISRSKGGPSNGAFTTYLWIRDENPRGALRRLATFLPKNYFIINIEDIEPLPYVRVPRVKKEVVDTSYRLRLYKDNSDSVRVSMTHDEIDHGLYYVMMGQGRNLADSSSKILDAAKILGVGLDEICAIPLKRSQFIEEYNLINLFQAANDKKESITYNEDTMYWHALKELERVHDFNKYSLWLNLWNNPTVSRVIGYSIDRELVDDINFVPDVNEAVANRYKEIYNSIRDNILNLYERHPILNYVQSYYLRYNTEEIFNILGENE